jgi:hypothetical protein
VEGEHSVRQLPGDALQLTGDRQIMLFLTKMKAVSPGYTGIQMQLFITYSLILQNDKNITKKAA